MSLSDQPAEANGYDEVIARILENRLSKSSKKQYDSRSKKIRMWVENIYPNLLENGLLKLSKFNARHFQKFIVDLGSSSSISVLNGYRSALFNMYKEQQIIQSLDFKEHISTYFQALKRKHTAEKASGKRKLAEGNLHYLLACFNG
jgi:hypothetical protein